MPFAQQIPRQFTQVGIGAIHPTTRGVYGLFRDAGVPQREVWVYVGKGEIRNRLFDHLRGDNPCISRERPTHFLIETPLLTDARAQQLILELDPVCNRRVD